MPGVDAVVSPTNTLTYRLPTPLLRPMTRPKGSRVGPLRRIVILVRRIVIPGHPGAACASQALPLEQRPRALQRHNQPGENDEGQVDELFAVMWINLQQQTESELSRVGKRRDGQHNPVSASV
jgi:hypothetical protein